MLKAPPLAVSPAIDEKLPVLRVNVPDERLTVLPEITALDVTLP